MIQEILQYTGIPGLALYFFYQLSNKAIAENTAAIKDLRLWLMSNR